MTLRPSCGILLVLGLLALVQLQFTASFGTITSEFFILPNSNTPCPMRPCYTLSQVMENPSNYFTSNTTVVFPPGYHEVSTEGQLVIQNVNNISLVGDNDNSTMIMCVGQFGLAFTNITNLTVSKLYFSMCGAPMSNTSQLAANLNEMIYVLDATSSFRIASSFPSMFSIYLLHITTFTANKLNISHSKGMGLLGVNIFGVSSIQQAVFVNNMPNCGIVFLDSYSPTATPVLHVTDSSFMFGSSAIFDIAAGLDVIALQTTFHVKGYIRNVTAYCNTGSILLRINCKAAVQATQVHCTGGDRYGFRLEFIGKSTNYRSQVIFHMSHSYFGRNNVGALINFVFITYFVRVKLENITVENNRQALEVLGMNHGSVLIMENVNINHNTGPLVIISSEKSFIEFHGYNTFTKNDCTDLVYSALHMWKCNAIFYGNTTFLQNKGRDGGAIYAKDSEINFQGNVWFLDNEGGYGGALMLYQNVSVVIGQFAEVSFVRNHAKTSGGAVYARDSQIIITGQKLSFVENEGYDGGAVTLFSGSTLYLGENGSITFVSNHAYRYGGAVHYVDDYTEDFEPAAELSKCFYGIFITKSSPTPTDLNYILEYTLHRIEIEFSNNTAGFAGTAIFGGWVDLCKVYINHKMTMLHEYRHIFHQTLAFNSWFHLHQSTQQRSLISSNPTRVCLCTNMSIPDCSITEYTITTYPGETLKIPAVAVGQRFGTVPSTVQSSFVTRDKGSLSVLLPPQYTQLVNVNCTNLMYTILSSPNRTEDMELTVEKHNVPQNVVIKNALKYNLHVNKTLINLQFSELTVHIEVRTCPLGFVFNNSSQTCICHPKLQQHEINCSIDTQTVYRRSPLWINATFLNETYTQVLVHNHCPFDYCNDGNIQFNMQHPDEQCALSRSGVLCGSCQQNLSHVLGTSNYKQCSSHFLLLIPVFIAAGIVLVVFLMLFNLTVSVGTINGLIFYANIVRANQAIFFPQGTNNEFLSIFIAWLNLDLGIETCFYSGLDAYAKTWLQFLFPVYIWIIVVLIIVSSHYSTTAAKLSGRNAVQVLATLFLLSYAKLLRITITAFSFTLLEYPDGSVKRIWLYDGNVDYLKGKHVALFVAALLLLVFISLPYTVALLFIQCLQYRSRYRMLAWVRRLKPLFDAYTGPYKDKHRYWPGLLLVVRVVLFLVFSVNVFGDPAISLLTIIVTTFCIYLFLDYLWRHL